MSGNQKDQPAATPPVIRLAAAEVDVAAAKDRLSDTVARLQAKLDPKLLAREATDEARRVGNKGAALARDNREVLGGLAAGVLLYLLGRPLLGLFRRRKYPKPQRAAKPMSATAPNERLAKRPHPSQAPDAPEPPVPPNEPSRAKTTAVSHPMMSGAPADTVSTTAPAASQASNEGAQLQGNDA